MRPLLIDSALLLVQVAFGALIMMPAARWPRWSWALALGIGIILAGLYAWCSTWGSRLDLVYVATVGILPVLVANFASRQATGRWASDRFGRAVVVVIATACAGIMSHPIGMVLMFLVAGASP